LTVTVTAAEREGELVVFPP
jgi:hypothetical protein